MNQSEYLQELKIDRPTWSWPSISLWLTIAGTVTGVISLLLLVFTTPSLNTIIGIIVLVFVLSFVVTPLLVYLWQIANVIYKRYVLHDRILDALQKSQNAVQALATQLDRERFIEIHGLQFVKEKLYITIKKKAAGLQIGNHLVVIDTSDLYPIGYFVISEVRQDDYVAVGIEIDSLWMGYVRNTGPAEMSVPANSAAMLVPEENANE